MELSMYGDLGLLIIRLALGAVFLAHGPAKLMDTKGTAKGTGLSKNMVMLVGIAETFAAAAMITGLWTNLAALIIIVVMAGAIYFKTQKWGKKFTGENGWELDFTVMAAAIAVLLVGTGSYGL